MTEKHVGTGNSIINGIVERVNPPTRRFLYGGYLALAIAAAALSWHHAPGALVPVVVIELLVAVAVALLVRAVKDPRSRAPKAFLWFVIVCMIAVMSLFISAIGFGWPETAAVNIARFLSTPEMLSGGAPSSISIFSSRTAQRFTADFTRPLDIEGTDDRYARQHALSKRPSLQIKSILIATDGADSDITIFADVIDLEGGTIVTNGGTLTIEANKIVSGGGAIQSFMEPPVPSPTGRGRNGGQVRLIVYQRVVGNLHINLSGGPGRLGSRGKDGLSGPKGAQGEHSSQSLIECKHGGGRGDPGHAGGNGEDGETGFPGGDGGILILSGAHPDVLARSIAFVAEGGPGGEGGAGGAPGAGGAGGEGGSGGGYCGGGEGGAPGPNGTPGKQGLEGNRGKDGNLKTINLE